MSNHHLQQMRKLKVIREELLTPMVAYIDVECTIGDFLADWGSEEIPTQNDYEDWLISTVRGHLENRKWHPQIRIREV